MLTWPQYCNQVAVTEAAHNVVLHHVLRCITPMLAQNIKQNLVLLYTRKEILTKVNEHRTAILEAIIACESEKVRTASRGHLAFIEEILLELSREHS